MLFQIEKSILNRSIVKVIRCNPTNMLTNPRITDCIMAITPVSLLPEIGKASIINFGSINASKGLLKMLAFWALQPLPPPKLHVLI